jgi:hypothetical protein
MSTPQIEHLRAMPRETLFNQVDTLVTEVASNPNVSRETIARLGELLDELRRRLIAHDNMGHFPF